MKKVCLMVLWLQSLVLFGCGDPNDPSPELELGSATSALISCDKCDANEARCYASGKDPELCEEAADRCYSRCLVPHNRTPDSSFQAGTDALFASGSSWNVECNESCQISEQACYASASSDAAVCYCGQSSAQCFARCAGRRGPPLSFCE